MIHSNFGFISYCSPLNEVLDEKSLPGHDVGVVEEFKVEIDVEFVTVGGDAVPLFADLLLPMGLKGAIRHLSRGLKKAM